MSDDDYDEDTQKPSQYDEFLFVNAAAPNTINMGNARDDTRVDAMLHARDSGDAPSVCSSVPPAQSRRFTSSANYQSTLMRVPEDDDRNEERYHRDEFTKSNRRGSRRTPSPPHARRSSRRDDSGSETSCDIDFTKKPRESERERGRESPIFLKSAHRNETDSPLHRRPALTSTRAEAVTPDERKTKSKSSSSSSSAATRTSHKEPARSKESPYERTLREFMAPPPPPPPPISKRETSIVSVARSVRSAVESSVSHPNHTASVYRHGRDRGDRNRDRYSTSSRHRRRGSADTRMQEIERENKMELLIELEKMQAMGVNLSFPLSMDEPEWKLRHEFERHLAHQTLVQRITLVKGILKLGSMVVRWVCSSFLRLEGWDKFIAEELDSGRYDSSLEQVYRSMFRKGTPNPWFSLALLVIGSAIAFHVGSVMSNGQSATSGPSGPGGMIGTILSSLFGKSSSSAAPAAAGNSGPLSFVTNMLRSAGTPPAAATSASGPVAADKQATKVSARPPSPPPPRPSVEASTGTRTRPRISPPSI